MTIQQITPEEVGTYYNQLGIFYHLTWGDNLHVGYWPDTDPDAPLLKAQEYLTDLLISHTQVGPRQKVLDVGCGAGRPAVRLAEKTGCDVVGITISRFQVEDGNHYAQLRQMLDQVHFHCIDAMKMPFRPESFDAVWAFESIFHMPDRGHVLRQIARVLRTGGRLVLTDSFERVSLTPEEFELINQGFEVNSFMSPEGYKELMPEFGFEIKEIVDISKNTNPTPVKVLEAIQTKKEDLKIMYGEPFLQHMDQLWPVLSKIQEEKLGYFLLVAEKTA